MERWSPRPVETGAAAAGGVVALLLSLAVDPTGRVLLLVAGAGLVVLAGTDVLFRPRLAADPAGLRIRTVSTRRDLPWSAVERLDVDEHQRYGLTARTLEIESGGGHLVILGRRSLGQDPRDVADALARIRFSVG